MTAADPVSRGQTVQQKLGLLAESVSAGDADKISHVQAALAISEDRFRDIQFFECPLVCDPALQSAVSWSVSHSPGFKMRERNRILDRLEARASDLRRSGAVQAWSAKADPRVMGVAHTVNGPLITELAESLGYHGLVFSGSGPRVGAASPKENALSVPLASSCGEAVGLGEYLPVENVASREAAHGCVRARCGSSAWLGWASGRLASRSDPRCLAGLGGAVGASVFAFILLTCDPREATE